MSKAVLLKDLYAEIERMKQGLTFSDFFYVKVLTKFIGSYV